MLRKKTTGNCSARCIFVATILTNYTKTILATKSGNVKEMIVGNCSARCIFG